MTASATVPEFPGYTVTADGDVYSPRGRRLRPFAVKGGYLRVSVKNATGRRRHMLVSRLVAAGFLGPCPEGQEVNHKDGRTANNHVTNLEYVTPSGNVRHSLDVLGRKRAPGERNGHARLTDDVVRRMRQLHADGVPAAEIGRRFGVDSTHTWRICTRRSWGHIA